MKVLEALFCITILLLQPSCTSSGINQSDNEKLSVRIPVKFIQLVPDKFKDSLVLSRVDEKLCNGACLTSRELLFVDINGSNYTQRNEIISVEEGLRAMYSYPSTDYFANVKIEFSNPKKFENDRKLIELNIKNIVDRKRWQIERAFQNNPEKKKIVESKKAKDKDLISFEEGTLNGLPYVGYTENVIGLTENTISQIVIFVPNSKVVITAYLLNQKKAKFADIEEFHKLRSSFLSGYTEFLAVQNN